MLAVWWLLAAACGTGSSGSDGPVVVATTSILGDIALGVVGDRAEVTVLMPVGADPHDYELSAQQAAALQSADLVVANGLGLEEAFADVLMSIEAEGTEVLTVAPLVDPLPFATGDEGALDPHVWMDPLRNAEAARLVAVALAEVAPGVDWAANAERYAEEMRAADEDIAAQLTAIPDPRRKLVTNHDALGYFAARYDFEIVGVVVPGGSTLADPSSADLSRLVATIQREGIDVIFAETSQPVALAEAVAAEFGGEVAVVELQTGSLGPPGSPADTLVGMLRSNAELIADALGD